MAAEVSRKTRLVLFVPALQQHCVRAVSLTFQMTLNPHIHSLALFPYLFDDNDVAPVCH